MAHSCPTYDVARSVGLELRLDYFLSWPRRRSRKDLPPGGVLLVGHVVGSLLPGPLEVPIEDGLVLLLGDLLHRLPLAGGESLLERHLRGADDVRAGRHLLLEARPDETDDGPADIAQSTQRLVLRVTCRFTREH